MADHLDQPLIDEARECAKELARRGARGSLQIDQAAGSLCEYLPHQAQPGPAMAEICWRGIRRVLGALYDSNRQRGSRRWTQYKNLLSMRPRLAGGSGIQSIAGQALAMILGASPWAVGCHTSSGICQDHAI